MICAFENYILQLAGYPFEKNDLSLKQWKMIAVIKNKIDEGKIIL